MHPRTHPVLLCRGRGDGPLLGEPRWLAGLSPRDVAQPDEGRLHGFGELSGFLVARQRRPEALLPAVPDLEDLERPFDDLPRGVPRLE